MNFFLSHRACAFCHFCQNNCFFILLSWLPTYFHDNFPGEDSRGNTDIYKYCITSPITFMTFYLNTVLFYIGTFELFYLHDLIFSIQRGAMAFNDTGYSYRCILDKKVTIKRRLDGRANAKNC